MPNKSIVAEKRKYRVKIVNDAKNIAKRYLQEIELSSVVEFGLPEVDDRYHYWRVPLVSKEKENIGEVVIDAFTSLILNKQSTKKEILESRLLGRNGKKRKKRW